MILLRKIQEFAPHSCTIGRDQINYNGNPTIHHHYYSAPVRNSSIRRGIVLIRSLPQNYTIDPEANKFIALGPCQATATVRKTTLVISKADQARVAMCASHLRAPSVRKPKSMTVETYVVRFFLDHFAHLLPSEPASATHFFQTRNLYRPQE